MEEPSIRAMIDTDTLNSGDWIDSVPSRSIPSWAKGGGRYRSFKLAIRLLVAAQRENRTREVDAGIPTEEERDDNATPKERTS